MAAERIRQTTGRCRQCPRPWWHAPHGPCFPKPWRAAKQHPQQTLLRQRLLSPAEQAWLEGSGRHCGAPSVARPCA